MNNKGGNKMTEQKPDTYTVAVRGWWSPVKKNYGYVRACGHNHQTIDEAQKCTTLQKQHWEGWKIDICVWKIHNGFLQLRRVMEVE